MLWGGDLKGGGRESFQGGHLEGHSDRWRDIGSLAGRQLGEQIRGLTSFSPSHILLGLLIAFRRSGSRTHRRTIHTNQEQRAGGRVRGGVEGTSTYGFSYDLLFQLTLSF